MATKRARQRADGSTYWQVRYRIDGQESSLSLDGEVDAEVFRELVNRVGPARALEIHGIDRANTGMTVTKWLAHYIEHLTADKRTVDDYRQYVRIDIGPALGVIPLAQLSRDDIARWIQAMRDAGAAGKTIANKHGFLSAALNAATSRGHIPANPALGVRLPRTEHGERRFLTRAEFNTLVAEVAEYWQPMIRFLVTSGARLGEATSLRPGDVNLEDGTVRIIRGWKRDLSGGHRLGPTKTKKSERTINVDRKVLDQLDYSGEWLFTNSGRGARNRGGPVRAANLRANVWWPALERAQLPPPRPRLHDLRHTCASWLIAKGKSLPVIQQHLGHESIKTTVDLYGHLDRSSYLDAATALGEMLD